MMRSPCLVPAGATLGNLVLVLLDLQLFDLSDVELEEYVEKQWSSLSKG